jgi:hypothetical protein
MALINIDAALKKVIQQVKRLSFGEAVEVLSYKRNRGITLLLREDGSVYVREHGYREKEFFTTQDDLPRLLKSLFKIEFPRSRKIRIYRIRTIHELNRPLKRL